MYGYEYNVIEVTIVSYNLILKPENMVYFKGPISFFNTIKNFIDYVNWIRLNTSKANEDTTFFNAQ